MNYNIGWSKSGVFIKLYDNVDEHLIVFVNGLIIDNELFGQINYQIWDFSDVSNYTINAERGKEVGVLDKAASIWNKRTKVAIVTENELLINYTNGYIEEIASTAWECKIFPKLEYA